MFPKVGLSESVKILCLLPNSSTGSATGGVETCLEDQTGCSQQKVILGYNPLHTVSLSIVFSHVPPIGAAVHILLE